MRDGNNDWGGDGDRQSQGEGVGINGNRDRGERHYQWSGGEKGGRYMEEADS